MKNKKYLTLEEIKKIFSDPNSLHKGLKIWNEAERKGRKNFLMKSRYEKK